MKKKLQAIPITRPVFDAAERELLVATLESGWIVQGPRVAEFEALFGRFVGSAHSVATSSCTTALHLALAVLGLRPGDEVVVPAFTWIATANAVEYVGARPVFCDIDLRSYNIDVSKLEVLLNERTKAVIPVHLFGLCADMAPILSLARRYGLRVVEDAACALGAWYGDMHAGTLGDVGCFSFHPRKSVTTGEGGMLTTACEEWAVLARQLRDHGGGVSDRVRHEGEASYVLPEFQHLGYNYRMTDLQGALGCAQMGKAQQLLDARERLAGRYDRLLAGFHWLRTPAVPVAGRHGHQAYVCLFAPEELSGGMLETMHQRRNRMMSLLAQAGISTRPGTHAVHVQGYYARKYGITPSDFPAALAADRLTLALPLYPQMQENEQDRVVQGLSEAFEACAV